MVEITVAPYLAGTVNHAMMDETTKTLAWGLAWITDPGRGRQCTERGEAEDKDGSMSDTSILCTRNRDLLSDLLIPIKANRPMTKSQCFRILLRAKHTLLYSIMMLVSIIPYKNLSLMPIAHWLQ